MIKNNLDKSLGTAGSTSGVVLFLAGIAITIWISKIGLIFVFAGAFTAFTYTCTLLDMENRRMKHATYFFGLIPHGEWIAIHADMKIGVKRSNRVQTVYSRANTRDVVDKSFRIMLYSADNKEIVPIMKCDTLPAAKTESEKLSKALNLEIL